MMGPAGYRSSLARAQAREAPSEDNLVAMRRAAWRMQGVVVLRPEDIRDDWTRQALINENPDLVADNHRYVTRITGSDAINTLSGGAGDDIITTIDEIADFQHYASQRRQAPVSESPAATYREAG